MNSNIHPLVPCLTRLRRFLLNLDTIDGTTRRGSDHGEKEPYHALGLRRVVIGLGLGTQPGYPKATIIAQPESTENSITGGAIHIVLVTDKVREDDAVEQLLNLSYRTRNEIRRCWPVIGGEIEISHEGIAETSPWLSDGPGPDGQPLPPLQMIRISIPIRSVTSR